MIFTIPLDKKIIPINIIKNSSLNSIEALHFTSQQGIHFTGLLPDEIYPFVYTGKSKKKRLWHGEILESNTIETKGDKNDVDGLVFESTDVRMILVSKNIIEQYLRETFSGDNVSSYYEFNTYKLSDEILCSFLDVHHDILNNIPVSDAKLKNLILNILKTPIKKNNKLDKRYLLVSKAISLMKQNFKEPLKINELANKLDVSIRNLEMAFKMYIGIPPKTYYKRILLLYLEMELRNSEDSTVSSVVQDFQIYNLSQFGASFKDFFSVTPSEVLDMKKTENPFGWNEKVFLEYI